MKQIPDHPDIARILRYGLPESPTKFCPICGEPDPENFYFNALECVGCSACVESVCWEDVEEDDLNA